MRRHHRQSSSEDELERQARMSLQTESPESKAKREQALRNLLAARRRKVQSAVRRRQLLHPSNRSNKFQRPVSSQQQKQQQQSKQHHHHHPSDMFDMHVQETRQLVRVLENRSNNNNNNNNSPSSTTEARSKKTVAIPDFLYNHFRPVESNVPIEDMSQFLYFGQRLRRIGISTTTSSSKSITNPSIVAKDLQYLSSQKSRTHVTSRPLRNRSYLSRTGTILNSHQQQPQQQHHRQQQLLRQQQLTRPTDSNDDEQLVEMERRSSSSSSSSIISTGSTVVPATTTIVIMPPRQQHVISDPSPLDNNEVTTTAMGFTNTQGPRKLSVPLENEKMYKAKNNDNVNISNNDNNSSSSSSSSDYLISTTVKSYYNRTGSERSRNIPDNKTSDGVLPIMQLYNTSSMFNDSDDNSVSINSSDSETTTVASSSISYSTTSLPTTTTTTIRPSTNSSSISYNSLRTKLTTAKPTATTTTTSTFHPTYYPIHVNKTTYEPGLINVSEVISRRHDGDAIASQETVVIVTYVLASLILFPIALGVALILRRLILRNRKVLEESDTASDISCRKDALSLENGDVKTSLEKTITKLPRIQYLCHEPEKPPPTITVPEPQWEFPRDKLRLQTVLGEGNFGQVWKAEADDLSGHQGTTRLVAVKTVKEGASDREKEDLVRELEIMQRVGSHPNVVTLLGCCTEQEPHYLILEYVMYGKLLQFLHDHRNRQDYYNFSQDSAALTSRDLTVFGYCVARGMEYLSSKKIIHRDLAARNVLIDHNKLCKIADFGMSRFANSEGEVIETRHGRNALPIRWMAPESLVYSLFTSKTDVWSFGILMWEIVTLGSTPYTDMTAKQVVRNVQSGYRLERPSHCRSELFRLIARCWHADPVRRPDFQSLRRDLTQLLEDNMKGCYVDLENFAPECPD